MTSIMLKSRYYRLYPPDRPLGYADKSIRLDAARTAFILIDVNGREYDADYRSRDKALDPQTLPARREVVHKRIRPSADAARAARVPVVYVSNSLSPGLTRGSGFYKETRRVRNQDVLNAWREPKHADLFAFSDAIAPRPGDYVLQKQFFSAFVDTALERLLRSLRIQSLILVGFDLRICLGMTAVDAMYRDYDVIVLRDCTHTYEFPETEREGWATFMGIRAIETMAGYTAVSSDWIAACSEASS